MKISAIEFKRSLGITMTDAIKRLNELEGQNKKALGEEFKEWIIARESGKEQLDVLYAHKIKHEDYKF